MHNLTQEEVALHDSWVEHPGTKLLVRYITKQRQQAITNAVANRKTNKELALDMLERVSVLDDMSNALLSGETFKDPTK